MGVIAKLFKGLLDGGSKNKRKQARRRRRQRKKAQAFRRRHAACKIQRKWRDHRGYPHPAPVMGTPLIYPHGAGFHTDSCSSSDDEHYGAYPAPGCPVSQAHRELNVANKLNRKADKLDRKEDQARAKAQMFRTKAQRAQMNGNMRNYHKFMAKAQQFEMKAEHFDHKEDMLENQADMLEHQAHAKLAHGHPIPMAHAPYS